MFLIVFYFQDSTPDDLVLWSDESVEDKTVESEISDLQIDYQFDYKEMLFSAQTFAEKLLQESKAIQSNPKYELIKEEIKFVLTSVDVILMGPRVSGFGENSDLSVAFIGDSTSDLNFCDSLLLTSENFKLLDEKCPSKSIVLHNPTKIQMILWKEWTNETFRLYFTTEALKVIFNDRPERKTLDFRFNLH